MSKYAARRAVAQDLRDTLEGLRTSVLRERTDVEDTWKDFLCHCFANVPAYHSRVWRGDVHETLQQLPTIRREVLLSQASEYLSSKFSGAVTSKTTSGSTGAPLRIWFDTPARAHMNSRIYSLLLAAYPDILKGTNPGSTVVAHVSDRVGADEIPFILPIFNFSLLRRFTLSNKGEQRSIISSLLNHKPLIIYGKPHCIRSLAESARRLDLKLPVFLVLTGGEELYKDDRNVFQDVFQAPIIDSYATTECGLIALSNEKTDELTVDEKYVFLEILRSDGVLCREGVGELVITSRQNWVFPILRYRTGDVATVTLRGDRQTLHRIRRLQNVEHGRFDATSERIVASALATEGIWDYTITVRGRFATLCWSGPENAGKSISAALSIIVQYLKLDGAEARRLSHVTKIGGKRQRFLSTSELT